MRIRRTAHTLPLAAFLGTGILTAQGVTVKEEKPGLLKKAAVTAAAAIATAQAKLPNAKLSSAEIERENGRLIYSFDFKTAGRTGIDEVNVDAMTGKLVGGIEHENPAAERAEAAKDSSTPKARKP